MPMKEEYILIESGRIEKSGNPVFTDLNLTIYKKQMLGLIFDSILERKNLQEFLKGSLSLSEGKIYLEEKKADAAEAARYMQESISFIEKESKLLTNLHIEENVFMFTDRKGLINRRKYMRRLYQLIKTFDLELEVHKPVSELSVKERVITELLKAYAEQKKIIILTYITGFLKKNELGDILMLLKQMQQQGMTFILVEQFENILFEWTDQVAVIRHGKTAGIFDTGTVNREMLYSALMKGQKTRKPAGLDNMNLEEEGEPVLQFEEVCTNVLTDFSLEIGAGEVQKIYYMDDESFEHIIDLLKGYKRPSAGRILLAGREYTAKNIVQAVDQGVCFIEESPYDNMLFYNMSVRDNLAMALTKKVPFLWFKNRFIKSVDQLVELVNIEDIARIKLRRLEPHLLQQIAYYKWYLYAPKVVVCIKPFTETDIHLQEITVGMIANLKSRGIAIILLTPNYSELYRVDGDTIYLKNGRMVDEDEVYQTLYKR